MGGNTSYGEGNLVQEIEDNIQKLRDDVDDIKKFTSQENRIIKNVLDTKLKKEDGENIENNVVQRVQGMIEALERAMPDREVIRKRFNGLEKTVSIWGKFGEFSTVSN